MDIGKAAIAAALIVKEANEITCRNPNEDWYRYLFEKLSRNMDAGLDQPLTILTFNYDRCLDQYLHDAFLHSYAMSRDRILTLFQKQLQIIHLHGSLCSLPFQSEVGHTRGYAKLLDRDGVRLSAPCIRIIHEQKDDDPVFQKAHEALMRAERIVFLGFGYESTNVRRLLAGNWLQRDRRGPIVGTGYNLTHSEAEDVKKMFGGKLTIFGEEGDCRTVLRNQTGLLS